MDDRIDTIINNLITLASGNFELNEFKEVKGDSIDAINTGIIMLSEQLNVSMVSRDELLISNREKEVLLKEMQSLLEKNNQNEHYLSKAQTIGRMGHYIMDPITGNVEGSETLFELFDVGQDQPIFEAFASAVHPEDADLIFPFIDKTIKEGVPYDTEHRVQHADGSVLFIHSKGEISEFKEGRRMFGTVQDITERKQIEQKLNIAETKYKTVFEQASEGIFIINDKGNYIDVNQRACDLLGYSKEELLNLHVTDILEKEHGKNVPPRYEQLKKQKSLLTERLFVRKDGSTFPGEVSSKVLSDGKMQGFVRDISERKQFENDIIVAKEKAEESNELKSAFLANVSHEIRTPLNGILGFTQLLLDNENLTEDERKQHLNIVKSSGKNLLNIITDIIDISKIEANQFQIDNQPFNLNKLLKETVQLLVSSNRTLPNDKVQLKTKMELNDEDTFYLGDPLRIQQVIMNLLSNSIKFTKTGEIVLGYNYDNDAKQVKIYVKDTGIGIDEKYHEKIFQRFGQVNDIKNRSAGGTGLGLPISKSIIELMGGKLWLSSSPENGTTFFVALGLTQTKAPELRASNKNAIIDWSTKKLLIVEDNFINQMYLQKALKETGINMNTVGNGEDAVDYANNNPLDIILMDVNLPGISGYEAIKKIREKNINIPIIVQTGYSMSDERERSLQSGATEYISKPIDIYDLKRLIKGILDC